MEISFEKKKVLIEWINCATEQGSISVLQDLKNSVNILKKLINNIDPDVSVPTASSNECLSFAVCYIKGFFSNDIVNEKEVLLGNDLEIGKLLCLILELTLTSENNIDMIERVQNLPKSIQTGIMSITTLVGENSQNENLSEILGNWLVHNDFEDLSASSGMSPIVSRAVMPIASSTIFESPKLSSTIGDLSGSPLHLYSVSPQALYRKVVVENKKLKQKVRHSELFLKQQSQFIEQLDAETENEKKEMFSQHTKLVKDHEILQQKFRDSELSLLKHKEEIEFLQLEVQSKDKEFAEQLFTVKELKETIESLRESLDHFSSTDTKLQAQQSINSEIVLKNTSLTLRINQLEEEKLNLKTELLNAKDTVAKLSSDLLKKQGDYIDQTKHLENEVKRLETELLNSQACQEVIGDAFKWENEVAKLKNSLNSQEHTIVNMGLDSQRKDHKLKDLMNELDAIRQKYDEESESFKKQSSQFMDQISSLLKQTDEQKVNQEQLTIKIQRAEERSKLLEKQIENYEQNEKKISEQILVQGSDLKAKTFGVTSLQHELDETKSKLIQQSMLSAQLEAKLDVLKLEKQNRIELEKQNQNLLMEILHLKHSQEKYDLIKEEATKLKCFEEECRVLREKNVCLELELKLSVERCSELKDNAQLNKQYEQKCIVLDEKLTSLNEAMRLKEERFDKEMKEMLMINKRYETDIKTCHDQIAFLQVKNKELEDFKNKFITLQSFNEKLQTEVEKLKCFEEDCKILNEKNVRIELELKSGIEKCNELKENVQLNKQYEQKCILLDEKLTSLNEAIHLKEKLFEREISEILTANKKYEADIKSHLDETVFLKVENKKLEELQSQLVTVQSVNDKLKTKNSDLQESVKKYSTLENEIVKLKEELKTQYSENTSKLICNNNLFETDGEHINNIATDSREVADLKIKLGDLLNEKLDLLTQLDCEKELNEALKRNNMLSEKKIGVLFYEKELLEKELKRQSELFDAERIQVNEHVDNAILEYQDSILTYQNDKILFQKLRSDNKSLMRDLELKNQSLKKTIEALNSSKSCTAKLQKLKEKNDVSSVSDGMLKISDLEALDSKSNRADEIFQRSRSMRTARRKTLLSVTREDDLSETEDDISIGSYSLRRTAERRRSLQPRRYLGGRTPPSKRTIMGAPAAQTQMCNFTVEGEQEPEVMDDMEWGRIAHLKETLREPDAEEKTRLDELHRRNTLCLPHLKSSYPIELSVKGANQQDVQMKSLGKRKNDVEEDAPRATYKKWKTEDQLLNSLDHSNFTRAVKSDSNIRNLDAGKIEKPQLQCTSFEISVEPAKRNKPSRFNRSIALSSIKDVQIAAPQKLQESLNPVVLLNRNSENKSVSSNIKVGKSKDLLSQLTRGDNKRASFSRATHKMAASFRGKMMAKNK